MAFGDDGLTYKYSNNVVPARAWTPLLKKIKDAVEAASGQSFNFVLVNRYAGVHNGGMKGISQVFNLIFILVLVKLLKRCSTMSRWSIPDGEGCLDGFNYLFLSLVYSLMPFSHAHCPDGRDHMG